MQKKHAASVRMHADAHSMCCGISEEVYMKSSDNRFLSKIAILLICLTVLMLTVGCNNGTNVKWDYQADVVIIGAGGAGLPAGLKAM